jgi:hypothetical protein
MDNYTLVCRAIRFLERRCLAADWRETYHFGIERHGRSVESARETSKPNRFAETGFARSISIRHCEFSSKLSTFFAPLLATAGAPTALPFSPTTPH